MKKYIQKNTKKIIGVLIFLLVITLTIVSCSCANSQTMYGVESFDDIKFSGKDEFKEYFANANVHSTYQTNESWSIKGSTEVFDTKTDAIDYLWSKFQVGTQLMETVTYDENGIATSYEKIAGAKTVYKKADGNWEYDRKLAALSYTEGAQNMYSINLYGEGNRLFTTATEAEDEFVKKYVKHVPGNSQQKLAVTDLANGDYVISGGQKFIWNDARIFGETVKSFLPGATVKLGRKEYMWLNAWNYTYEQNLSATPVYVGLSETQLISNKFEIEEDDVLRVYNRNYDGSQPTIAGNTITEMDYNYGLDYQWNSIAKKFILVDEDYWTESGLNKSTIDFTTFNCEGANKKLGYRKSVWACFDERDIKDWGGTIYNGDRNGGVRFTNVDKEAFEFRQTASSGTNRAGWYRYVSGGYDGTDNYAYLRNTELDTAAIYFEKSNTLKSTAGKMTTSPRDALFTNRAAGFYIEGYTTNQDTNSSNYIAYSDAWVKVDGVAGKRQLTFNVSDALTTTSEYWYFGDKKYTKYSTLLAAETAGRRIAKAELVTKYVYKAGGIIYVSENSFDEAIYLFLNTFDVPSKFVAVNDIDNGKNFDALISYVPTEYVSVYIYGQQQEMYFNSDKSAFKWMIENNPDLIIRNDSKTMYEYMGIEATSIEELADAIWENYSYEIK